VRPRQIVDASYSQVSAGDRGNDDKELGWCFVWVRGDEIKLPGAAVLKVAAMPLEEFKGLQLKFGEILLETEVENPEADVSDPEAAVNTSS